MSDVTTRGPAHPSWIIFVATAPIGIAVGFGTGDIGWFTLAIVASATLLCTVYGLMRRRLGWRPLNADYLADLMRVISPH
ncbi:hypothetical protein MKK75_02030 [Methylobacterium sp. J-030]|uniref:hypothetical protein n=1 Tax=Methylobacterium sp. J-030 TaxID=2836627 RepID=UPI001FBBD5AB|nr:hypothetical protein [Methylobacterium sp. J-030]MCJ2067591.1 hypothetical protein [Methylobacterium sp. J-030]